VFGVIPKKRGGPQPERYMERGRGDVHRGEVKQGGREVSKMGSAAGFEK